MAHSQPNWFIEVLSQEGKFAMNVAMNIRNPFLKDVLIIWVGFCKEVKSKKLNLLSFHHYGLTHTQEMERTCIRKGIKALGIF